MAILANIKAVFDASSAVKAKEDIDKLKDASPQAANAIGRLEEALNTLKNPLIALGAALAAATTGMVAMGFSAIEAADNLRDLSIGSDTASSELQALGVVAEKSGGSLEELNTGLDFIAKGMSKGDEETKKFQKALDFFGVSMKNANGEMKSSQELAEEVAQAYTQTENSASKSAAAADALGRNYKSLIPTYLELGNKQDELNFLHEVGAIKTRELQDASDEYNDTMRDNQSIMEGLGNYAAETMLPLLQALASQFKESATNGGLLEGALTLLKGAFDGLVFIAKTVVAVLIGIDTTFQILGKSVGAFAAMVGAAASGEFSEAAGIFKEWKRDVSDIAETAGARISKMFAGIKDSAKAADEEVKKIDRGTYTSANPKKDKVPKVTVKVEKDPIEDANKALESLIDSLEAANKHVETGSKLQEMAAKLEQNRYKVGNSALKEQVLSLARVNDQLRANKDMEKALKDIQKDGDKVVQGLEDEIKKRTMTNAQYRQYIQLREIELAVAEKLDAVNKNIEGADERRRQIIEEGIKQKQRVKDATAEVAKADQDWTVGANQALAEYQDKIGSVANNTKELMTNAFSGAEDALVKLVTTGKADFGALAQSIIADLARMAIRALMTKAIMAFMGGFADGGAFSNGAQTPFASGDVVSSPTLFPMASGGVGMMGEAGPEAIMPLTRMPNGRLGVSTQDGAAGGGGQVINVGGINVAVQGSSGNQQQDAKYAQLIGATIEMKMKELFNTELNNQRRPGNQLNPTQIRNTW